MIIEDEPLIALNLKKLLEKKGFEVTGHAGNTEEAHTLFYANKPDIILSDIKLENDESGIDVIKELKKETIFASYHQPLCGYRVCLDAKQKRYE